MEQNIKPEAGKRHVKESGYHSEKLHSKKDKKRQEAKARQRHYESLSPKDKLALVKKRGGSVKELARLKPTKPKKILSPKS